MAKDNQPDRTVIEEAEAFCKRMQVESKLRNAIADITAKLNRSNLSAEEGERIAGDLAEAYRILKELEKKGLKEELK